MIGQRKLLSVTMVLILGLCSVATAQTIHKVGMVDFQEIVDSWPEAKQKLDALEQEYTQVQTQLDQRDKEIQQIKENLEARKGMFPSEAEEQKQWEEYRAMVKDYLDTFSQERKNLEERKKEMLEEVKLKVKEVVQDVAEREGYSLIVRKSDVVYSVQEYDVTDMVIEELKKRSLGTN